MFALLLEFANDLKFVAWERKPQLYPITLITIEIIFLQTYKYLANGKGFASNVYLLTFNGLIMRTWIK